MTSPLNSASRHVDLPDVREGWRLLALVGTGVLVVCVTLVATHSSRNAAFLSGLLAGLFLAGVGGFAAHTAGSGSRRMIAASEKSTLQQLRRAANDGWFAFDRLSFDSAWDCDHLVMGSGGLFAMQTAWCGDWDSKAGARRLETGARDAREVSRKAKQLLAAQPTRLSMEVHPVVVAWGPGNIAKSVDGVSVISGHLLSEWLAQRAHPRHSEADVGRAYAAINGFAGQQEAALGAPDPLTEVVAQGMRGLLACAATALAAGLAAFVGVMLIAASMRLGPVLVAAGAAVIGGWLFLRTQRLHYAGLGWLTGAATGGVVLLAIVALSGFAT